MVPHEDEELEEEEFEDEDDLEEEDSSFAPQSIVDVMDSAPPDQKAVGWWQVVKIEHDGGTVQEVPVDWVLAKNVGADTYGVLRKHIMDRVLPDHGEGEYIVKPCTQARQVLPDTDFYTFKLDDSGSFGSYGGAMDFDKSALAEHRNRIKMEEEQLRLQMQEQRLRERKEEMLGSTKKKSNPYAGQWVQWYHDNGLPVPPADEIPEGAPPAQDSKKSSEMIELMKVMMTNQQNSRASSETDALKSEIQSLKDALNAEPKEDKFATMMFQQMQEEKARAEEWRRKQEEDERKREEKLEERRREDEHRRKEEQERRDAERKEERERFEMQMKEERDRWKEELKMQNKEMERKEELARERAEREKESMFMIMKMFKDDSGSSAKQMLEMTKTQSELMQTAASSQFNMGTQATKAILDVASTVKESIGAGKDEEKAGGGVVSSLIEQAGKVLAPYAEVDAKAKAAQAIAAKLGISPDKAAGVLDMLGSDGLAGLAGAVPAGAGIDSMEGPLSATAPVPSANGQIPQGGDAMGVLIDKFAQNAPEIIQTIGFCMQSGEVDDVVEMFLEPQIPSPVRAIVLNWPYDKLVAELDKHLDEEQKTIFHSEQGSAWWNKFQSELRNTIKMIRAAEVAELTGQPMAEQPIEPVAQPEHETPDASPEHQNVA